MSDISLFISSLLNLSIKSDVFRDFVKEKVGEDNASIFDGQFNSSFESQQLLNELLTEIMKDPQKYKEFLKELGAGIGQDALKNQEFDDDVFNEISMDSVNTKELYSQIFDENGKVIAAPPAQDSTPEELADEDKNKSNFVNTLKDFFSFEGINKMFDTNTDGKIDEKEFNSFLSQIKGLDGEDETISLADMINSLSAWDIDLGKVIDEAVNDKPVLLDEEGAPVKYAPETSSAGISNPGVAPGSYPNSNYQTPASYSTPTSELNQNQDRTPDAIEKEIASKESEKTQINTDAESAIKGEEEKLQEAVQKSMEENKISQEIQDEYKEENERLTGEISDKEKQISDEETKIQDNTAVKEAKTEAISSVESQISSLESSKSSITDGDDAEQNTKNAEKRAEIDRKIENLNTEKTKLEAEKKKAEDAITEAAKNKQTYTAEKETLEKEKSQLLETLQEKYPDSKLDKVQKEIEQTKTEAEKNIADIKSAKDEAVKTLDGDIQTLKTELAKAKQKEETDKVISDNTFGEYNAEAGEKLAEAAKTPIGGSGGWCLKGVNDSLRDVYGGNGLSGLGSAYMAADALRGKTPGYEDIASHFKEVDVSREDLASLPAGAIVVWDNNQNGGGSNVSDLGKIHGHISISLGDGRESSDKIWNQTVNRDASYTVFYPVS